jgi:hypothetical protein
MNRSAQLVYLVEAEEGRKIITKGGALHDIIAQGWNAFK